MIPTHVDGQLWFLGHRLQFLHEHLDGFEGLRKASVQLHRSLDIEFAYLLSNV